MCELFGLNAPRPVKTNAVLKEFYARSATNPHGWGLAIGTAGALSLPEKEPVAAGKSLYLVNRLRPDICATDMIAHIRLATMGTVDYVNTHPFYATDAHGRRWTLAHNGTIFGAPALDRHFVLQDGSTDSECILLELVARMSAAPDAASAETRFGILADFASEISRGSTPHGNKVNLLIHDGEFLYAHTNFKDSLFCATAPEGVWLCTVPLASVRCEWRPLPFTSLCAFRAGELVRTASPHGHEYIYDPEDYRTLYAAYAAL
ncbi:MAG: class II glutamine amidotransferase [Kiritimatiellae bacterium]|nr:class II glutamine amidotransferase [Kiritimatiellia bacterium]